MVLTAQDKQLEIVQCLLQKESKHFVQYLLNSVKKTANSIADHTELKQMCNVVHQAHKLKHNCLIFVQLS